MDTGGASWRRRLERAGARISVASSKIDPTRAAGVAVAVMTLVSLASKMANQFGFFVYPDSYYYLLIAMSVASTGHVSGTLGAGGMPFPPPGYASMKVAYPILASGLMALHVTPELAGRVVTAGAAVLAVPAAYWAVRRLLESRRAAVFASALVALSYGITYWAGFVLSDSLSILLGFLFLASVAKKRRDGWTEWGDLLAGATLAVLLLSRPTYFVTLPFVAWIGVRRFGWTRKRLVTAGIACAFVGAAAAATLFPPATFSRSVLFRLLPVLGAALVVGAVGTAVIRALASRRPGDWLREHGAVTGMATLALASVIPAAVLVQLVLGAAGAAGLYPGLAAFATRDVAVVLGLIPGAYALSRTDRWDTGAALCASAIVLMGVYFWVEPRESRYLTHLLPFLVPVAASVVILLPPLTTGRPHPAASARATSRRRPRRAWVSAVTAAALTIALLTQGYLAFGRDLPQFLRTNYPREVARRIGPYVTGHDVIVSALPWPYYFHLHRPAWSATVLGSPKFLEYVPASSQLVVVEDAPMRFHYPAIADALARTLDRYRFAQLSVPLQYEYGYASVTDPRPVLLYRLTARELKAAIDAAAATTGTVERGGGADEPAQ